MANTDRFLLYDAAVRELADRAVKDPGAIGAILYQRMLEGAVELRDSANGRIFRWTDRYGQEISAIRASMPLVRERFEVNVDQFAHSLTRSGIFVRDLAPADQTKVEDGQSEARQRGRPLSNPLLEHAVFAMLSDVDEAGLNRFKNKADVYRAGHELAAKLGLKLGNFEDSRSGVRGPVDRAIQHYCDYAERIYPDLHYLRRFKDGSSPV
jgi:hypothetical protein